MKPVVFRWTGEVMEPLPPTHRLANVQYTVGEVYSLSVIAQRSMSSHRHFFAAVHEAWLSLPDEIAERFPTDEHLRKHALIRSGYADQRTIVCSSRAEALRLAEFIKPMDSYAIVSVQERTVYVFTAQSQSLAAMGKERFQDSKGKCLDWIGGLIGVSGAELAKQSEAA